MRIGEGQISPMKTSLERGDGNERGGKDLSTMKTSEDSEIDVVGTEFKEE